MTENITNPVSDEIALNDAANGNAVSSIQSAVEAMKNGGTNIMSTFTGEDFATKLSVLSAVTNAQPLSENLGKQINLSNVVIQVIEMPDEKTGVLTEVPRIILADADGTTYAAISNGIFKSLENIFAICGQPHTWDGPIPVVASEAKSRAGFRFMTLNVGEAPKKR